MRVTVTGKLHRAGWRQTAKWSEDPELALSVLGIAERWAERMEPHLAAGKNVADVAEQIFKALMPKSSEAMGPGTLWGDLMADYLEECWYYGSQFRRWYGASRWRRGKPR